MGIAGLSSALIYEELQETVKEVNKDPLTHQEVVALSERWLKSLCCTNRASVIAQKPHADVCCRQHSKHLLHKYRGFHLGWVKGQ